MAKIVEGLELKQWFLEGKRDLPWRKDPTPYRVWISEVMLQQTQAVVVVPYFLRWMDTFPSVKALAEAPVEEVIKLWEGLGYYSRARNIHTAAKKILELYDGNLPSGSDELSKLKGLGPYTVGAIRSFAFHEHAAAVDGNVIRVLARYFGIEEDIAKPKTVKKIWVLAEEILPESDPWVHNEALIELGATVCSKKPRCIECPLRKSCCAYQEGTTSQLPVKSKSCATTVLFRTVAIFRMEEKILAGQVSDGKIMAGLYEFPYMTSESRMALPGQLHTAISAEWAVGGQLYTLLPEVTHTFTRYRAYLQPVVFDIERTFSLPGFDWFSLEELLKLPFSSGHRRILIDYMEMHHENSTYRGL